MTLRCANTNKNPTDIISCCYNVAVVEETEQKESTIESIYLIPVKSINVFVLQFLMFCFYVRLDAIYI